MGDRDELANAIRDAIAPIRRDTQDRISNLRDSLRQDIRESEERTGARLARVEGAIGNVESRLSELAASVERLGEHQPIVLDFERFRKLEERLARLEDKLGQ